MDQRNIQERLQPKDSTVISFKEEISFTEKVKEKKIKEKKSEEESEEELISEESLELDSLEKEEAIRTGSFSKTIMQDGKKVTKKVKVEKRYYVEVRSILKYEDGEVRDETERYQVESITERENSQAMKNEDRFQYEILLTKGAPIYMYLTNKRTISRLDIAGKQYLMRGH